MITLNYNVHIIKSVIRTRKPQLLLIEPRVPEPPLVSTNPWDLHTLARQGVSSCAVGCSGCSTDAACILRTSFSPMLIELGTLKRGGVFLAAGLRAGGGCDNTGYLPHTNVHREPNTSGSVSSLIRLIHPLRPPDVCGLWDHTMRSMPTYVCMYMHRERIVTMPKVSAPDHVYRGLIKVSKRGGMFQGGFKVTDKHVRNGSGPAGSSYSVTPPFLPLSFTYSRQYRAHQAQQSICGVHDDVAVAGLQCSPCEWWWIHARLATWAPSRHVYFVFDSMRETNIFTGIASIST